MVAKLIYEFEIIYKKHFEIDYIITNPGKERMALGHLLSAYRKKNIKVVCINGLDVENSRDRSANSVLFDHAVLYHSV